MLKSFLFLTFILYWVGAGCISDHDCPETALCVEPICLEVTDVLISEINLLESRLIKSIQEIQTLDVDIKQKRYLQSGSKDLFIKELKESINDILERL